MRTFMLAKSKEYQQGCASQDVTDTGGWCLVANTHEPELAPGRPMSLHHVTADAGVAAFLTEFFHGQSVLDIGAGIGQYQVWFDNHGAKLTGYKAFDGAANVEEFTNGNVEFTDLTVPGALVGYIADWVMCLEVGEHIPANREDVLLHNIHNANRKGIILTWAIPGPKRLSHLPI